MLVHRAAMAANLGLCSVPTAFEHGGIFYKNIYMCIVMTTKKQPTTLQNHWIDCKSVAKMLLMWTPK